MRYQDYGGVFGKVGNDLVKSVLESLIHVGKRFVEHQHVGTANYGASQQSSLQLSTRNLSDSRGAEFGKAHKFQCFLDGALLISRSAVK